MSKFLLSRAERGNIKASADVALQLNAEAVVDQRLHEALQPTKTSKSEVDEWGIDESDTEVAVQGSGPVIHVLGTANQRLNLISEEDILNKRSNTKTQKTWTTTAPTEKLQQPATATTAATSAPGVVQDQSQRRITLRKSQKHIPLRESEEFSSSFPSLLTLEPTQQPTQNVEGAYNKLSLPRNIKTALSSDSSQQQVSENTENNTQGEDFLTSAVEEKTSKLQEQQNDPTSVSPNTEVIKVSDDEKKNNDDLSKVSQNKNQTNISEELDMTFFFAKVQPPRAIKVNEDQTKQKYLGRYKQQDN